MGRPPSNGGPSFRFNQAEIAEMEAILQAHKTAMPERQVLVNLAEKFSKSEERSGKIEVQMKQVWNWFQNRRYAIRAKAAKAPGRLNMTPMGSDGSTMVKGVPQVTQPHVASSVNVRSLPQAPQHPTVPSASVRTFPQAPHQPPAFSVQSAGRAADNSQMEYEAKSARDGAWYDVSTFLSHRSLETGDPEVFVRFAGFGAEEDEWVNVRKNVRQRSLPCEASECVAVLPADLILCFQEGKEQALYFDAHVLDAQRRRHDVRGCRCRFLVRYDHDQSEEIVALRKICRRPETDYRLHQLHAVNESITTNHNKNGANNNNNNNNNMHTVSTLRVYPPAEVQPKQQHKVEPPEAPQKRQRLDSMVQPEVSQTLVNVEPLTANVSQNQQTVQPAVEKVEKVPVELQNVQPLMPDPVTEVSVEPLKVEAEPQKEAVVSGSLVEVQAELHDVQLDAADQPHTSALEVKTEEPMMDVTINEPKVVEESTETKIKDPVSSSDPNVVQEAKTMEPVDHVVVQEAKTDETVVLVDPDLVQEVKTKEPVDSNVAQEAKTKEPADSNVAQEAKTVEPVDSKVAQEAKTKEPVDSNVAQEVRTEEPVDSKVVQEVRTEEPVDANAVQEAKTEEPVDSNAFQEAKTEESVVPVDDPMVIEGEIEQPKVSETMEKINEDKHANVEENVNNNHVENLDVTPENGDVAVAMEE